MRERVLRFGFKERRFRDSSAVAVSAATPPPPRGLMAGEDSSSGTGTDPWRGRGRGPGGEDKLGGAAHPGAERGARLGRASCVLTLAERVSGSSGHSAHSRGKSGAS